MQRDIQPDPTVNSNTVCIGKASSLSSSVVHQTAISLKNKVDSVELKENKKKYFQVMDLLL